jgi:hypothetical protein
LFELKHREHKGHKEEEAIFIAEKAEAAEDWKRIRGFEISDPPSQNLLLALRSLR